MIHAMHALGVQHLDNPVILHNRMPYYAERVYQKCGLVVKKGSKIDKESSNNVIFCNRTLEDFHGNPEIQK